jgi:predicted Fe-Mo cluster-binding NifX family protein
MKTAFTVWKNRIAPLFDVSREIHVVEMKSGQIVAQSRVLLENAVPAFKARQLGEMGIDTLVCGAISRAMQDMVMAYGITLVAFISGDLNGVIDAWQSDKLCTEAFRMPGSCGHAEWGFHQGPTTKKGDKTVNSNRGSARKQDRGGKEVQGRGSSGRGRRRQNAGIGQAAAGDGTCICAICGHQEVHQRGVPCMTQICPKCGGAMTRHDQEVQHARR